MIGSAVEKGKTIYVYDEKGRTLFTKPGDQLLGFTGSTVTIKKGHTAYTFNDRGRTEFTKPL